MSSYDEYKEKYHIVLDPEQDRVCAETEGHILLLAVPGSGKTTVMTARLGYLTKGLGVPGDQILAVTYSVAGAREMQNRYEALFGTRDVEIRTIHGFCARIIRAYEETCHRTAFTLMDSEIKTSALIRDIMKSMGEYPTENELRDVKTALTFCRNGLLTEEEIAGQIHIEGWDFPEILRRYRAYKLENRLMDYDDQLFYGYHILCRYPEACAAYAGSFRYVCVDEAQDSSKLQHLIIRKAAEKCGNLFMVGDEDQSIYGFRAAYPEALLEFGTVYPDAVIRYIGQNYRSTGNIVALSRRFIAANRDRMDKDMRTGREDGEMPVKKELPDLSGLPDYVAECARNRDPSVGSLAVLARLNDSLIPLADRLEREGIPFRLRGGDGLFFTHYIVSDIVNILRFAADPFDAGLFSVLYYKFCCGISRRDMEYALKMNTGKQMLSFPDFFAETAVFQEKIRKKAKRLSDALCRVNGYDSFRAIRTVINDTGYGLYLSHRTKDRTKINTLLAIAREYPVKADLFARLTALSGIVKQGMNAGEGVILSTIHSAKGMEFDRVLLCDAKNGILPSVTVPENGKNYSGKELHTIEEDRRLFYVGATRAKNRLEFVTYPAEYGEETEGWDYVDAFLGIEKPKEKEEPVKGKTLSREWDRNPASRVTNTGKPDKKLIAAFAVGENVMHKVFGEGIIEERKGDILTVRFFRYPIPKKLLLSVCLQQGILKLL